MPLSKKPKVLVVLDDPKELQTIDSVLNSSCEVSHASSCRSAIEEFIKPEHVKNPFVLVMANHQMSDEDGLMLLQRIKKYDTDVSVTLLSSEKSFELAVEALRLEAFDLLVKPLDSELLMASTIRGIQKTIEKRQLKRRQHVGDAAAQLAHDVSSILTIMSFHETNDPIIDFSVKRIIEMYGQFRRTINGSLYLHDYPLEALLSTSHLNLQEWIEANTLNTVEVTCSDFPSCSINVDKIYFARVLDNLLRNAVQALESVKEPRKVRLAAEVCEGKVHIHVQDNGIGMSPQTMTKIFDPYFTTRKEGTGLGLNICKQFVQDMRGEISVTSVLGEGTTFTLLFPLSDSKGNSPFSTPVSSVMF